MPRIPFETRPRCLRSFIILSGCTVAKLSTLLQIQGKSQTSSVPLSVILRPALAVGSCLRSRFCQGATAIGVNALLLARLSGHDY